MTDLTHLMNLANAIDNPAPGHLHSSSSGINTFVNDQYESKSPMKQVKQDPDDSTDELGKPKNPLSRSQMRYVSNACFNCRALHRRCNGQKICSNCKKRGIECVYKEPTKRGPKPKGEKKGGSSDESSPPQPRRVKKEKTEPKVVDSREPLHIPQSNSPLLGKANTAPHVSAVSANLFTAYNGKSASTDEKGASETKARNLTSGATIPAHFKDSFNRNDAKVLLSSVTEDLGRIFPFASAYPLDEHKAWYYWDLVTGGSANTQTNPAQFIEMAYYCALFMHGYRCMRSDERALAFAERTEQLVKQFLFNTQGVGVPQLLTMLVGTLLLLGIFKLTIDEVDSARAFFLHSWNFLRLQNDSAMHPAIYHRTIAMAVGMSQSSDDRLHWLTKAESIPKEGQTLDNRVILAFVWISPLLRETPPNLFISLPSTPVLVTSKEGMELQSMLRYLKETEEAINNGVEQMKENDRFDMDAFNAFHVIVSACRAIVLSHLGFKAQAIDAVLMAVECFEKQKRLFVADPSTALALSYAIQVGRHFQESTLAKKGLTMLGEYNERCPIGAILYNRLIMQEHQGLLSANKLSVPSGNLPEVEVKKESNNAGNDQVGSAFKFPMGGSTLPTPSSPFNIVLPGINSGFTPKFFGDPMSPGGNLMGCPSPSPSPSPLPFLTGLTSSRGSFSLPPPSPSFFSPIITPNALRSSFSIDLGLGGSTTPTPK